ncbi:uroporphyrinogen-III C-methyltransferase [Shewanella sp. NIFS-20-20]|uniref:uroporphyrinogen-III C-methyltransferase n=1 Tax=Shewanella sp. NIFS-20-20 TaxID=2853806 RepID=UPI001C476C90|nr:uroporphyrinogen-III C-methyltransferase [Shewanella sp. NIFS-20-20]MBV7317271.1 uroporphyrinogen-III C-methyltransferase [Shewanella sp. NIFS-20-20]
MEKSPVETKPKHVEPASSHEANARQTVETVTHEDSSTPADAPTMASQPTPRHSGTNKLVWFCLLLLLLISLAAMGVSWWLYQQLSLQRAALTSQLDQNQQQLQQQLTQPSAAIVQLQQQLKATKHSAEQMAQLQDAQQRLSQKVSALSQRNPNHWMASEAQYLAGLAGRKLLLEGDPATAEQLLIAADERIAAMNDPALIPLRKALAKDIATMKAMQPVDITGTAFTLGQVIESLDSLPLNRAKMQASASETDNELSESLTDWRSNLAKTWHAITQDFVTISHRNTDITPLLSPDQRWYLTENIRTKLLQAQLALYRNDQLNYRQSLQMAILWIKQYYDLNSASVTKTLTTLETLEKLQLTPLHLDKLESTLPLKQLINYGSLPIAAEDIQ